MSALRLPLLALAAFAATATFARPSSAQQPTSSGGQPSPVATISVAGTGEDEVIPDRARLSLGVQTQAPTAAEAAARNARLQRAILDTLRALGVPQEQIRTSGYNVFPDQQFDPATQRARIRGYNVQNTVTIELRRLEQVSTVLDAALSKGANNAYGLQFFSSTPEVSRRRALARAVERARADAEAMAAAAGGQLGDLFELSSEVGLRQPRPMMGDAMMMEARAAAAPPTPISEGTLTTTATVHARWALVPRR